VLTRELINEYAKRWSIETTFRDAKDLRFGMGMKNVRVRSTECRDRLLLFSAFAIKLLTLLGAPSENLGMDRLLRVNTVKHRTYSLFRQGCLWYDHIPNMPIQRLRPLMKEFGKLIQQQRVYRDTLAFV